MDLECVKLISDIVGITLLSWDNVISQRGKLKGSVVLAKVALKRRPWVSVLASKFFKYSGGSDKSCSWTDPCLQHDSQVGFLIDLVQGMTMWAFLVHTSKAQRTKARKLRDIGNRNGLRRLYSRSSPMSYWVAFLLFLFNSTSASWCCKSFPACLADVIADSAGNVATQEEHMAVLEVLFSIFLMSNNNSRHIQIRRKHCISNYFKMFNWWVIKKEMLNALRKRKRLYLKKKDSSCTFRNHMLVAQVRCSSRKKTLKKQSNHVIPVY